MSNTSNKKFNMDEPVIYKNKALRDLRGIKDVIGGAGDPFLANIFNRAIECIERQEEFSIKDIVAATNNN